jgi:hypothetical protein
VRLFDAICVHYWGDAASARAAMARQDEGLRRFAAGASAA